MIKPIVLLLGLSFSSFSYAEERKELRLFNPDINTKQVQPPKPLEIFGKNSAVHKQIQNSKDLDTSSKPSVSKLGDNFFVTNPNGSKLICYKEISYNSCEALN